MSAQRRPDAAIVGGGPAGLACALELRRRGVADVLVLEREQQAGGIPRFCAHQGFGVRDLRRVVSGPRYARRYVELARDAGCRIDEEAMVTGWSPDGALEVTSPDGRRAITADAIVLATGCRERPRAARLVPGARPEGVMTTGTLQQLVKSGTRLRGRALIVGAEHVSFSALSTLRHAGAEVVGMTTDLSHHQSLPLADVAARVRYRTPVWTRTVLRAIHGSTRVERVELEDVESGATRSLACEIVVFTADWIPDHELAVTGAVEMDPGTRGPRVDAGLRTDRMGVFAAGNVLHPAEPADVAALSGRHAAVTVARWLAGPREWPERAVPIDCRAPLRWISPNAVGGAHEAPPRGRFLLRSSDFVRRSEVVITQDSRTLWRRTLQRLSPGRSSGLPARWTVRVDPGGGPIEVLAAHTESAS